MRSLVSAISSLWSTTRFDARGLDAYAERLMLPEIRQGVMTLALVFLLLLAGSVFICVRVGVEQTYVYTCAALAALAAHTWLAARRLEEIGALHALGMTLLVISGVSFVLLAHRTGAFGAALLTSVTLLFMVVPLVPWGLREASVVTTLVWALFSSSTWAATDRFEHQTLWTLQAFMLGAAVVSLTLVARSTRVRREDIHARFDLETARREMERLSYQDPLTSAWNRRFLEAEFDGFVERARKCRSVFHLLVIDVDRFKAWNDGCGHHEGDRLLQEVTRAFQQAVGESGYVARTGGDEFNVLLACDEPELVIEDAFAILEAWAARERPPAAPPLSLSVGVVSVPPSVPVDLERAFRAADDALYRAKRAGRDAAPGCRTVRVSLAAGDARRAS